MNGALGSYFRVALVLVLNIVAGAALAAPITVHIPVDISNMHPDVPHFHVVCRVYDEDSRSLTLLRAQQVSRLVDGAFNGTITVEGGEDPSVAAVAHSYRCFFMFAVTGVGGMHLPAAVPTESYNQSQYVNERLEHQANTPFTHYVEGLF